MQKTKIDEALSLLTASRVPKRLQAKWVLPFRSLFTNSDFLAQVQTENKICAQKDKRDSSPNNCSFCRIITISIRARPNARKKIGGGGKLGGTISCGGKVGRKKWFCTEVITELVAFPLKVYLANITSCNQPWNNQFLSVILNAVWLPVWTKMMISPPLKRFSEWWSQSL